jgi:hypothetical protein
MAAILHDQGLLPMAFGMPDWRLSSQLAVPMSIKYRHLDTLASGMPKNILQ